MWQSFHTVATQPIPIKVTRIAGIQAALELGIPIIAILTDGLILELPEHPTYYKQQLEEWKQYVLKIDQWTSLQWDKMKWIQEGFDLTLLRPGSECPEKEFRKSRNRKTKIEVRGVKTVYEPFHLVNSNTHQSQEI